MAASCKRFSLTAEPTFAPHGNNFRQNQRPIAANTDRIREVAGFGAVSRQTSSINLSATLREVSPLAPARWSGMTRWDITECATDMMSSRVTYERPLIIAAIFPARNNA
jgi:hypothetical protein